MHLLIFHKRVNHPQSVYHTTMLLQFLLFKKILSESLEFLFVIILKRFDNVFQLIEEKMINDTFAKTTNHRKNFNGLNYVL